MKKYIHLMITGLIILLLGYHADTYAIKHIVHVGNYYFNPSSLNVAVGDTVRWVWDNGSHTTTSGVIPGGASSWDANINTANHSFEYRVLLAGDYNYVCTPHAAMGMVGSFTASLATAVGEHKDNSMVVYPNPSRGVFKVSFGNTLNTEAEISLIDLSGKTISAKLTNGSGEMTFDLSDFSKGYYFLRLKSDAGTTVRRIAIVD